MIGALVVAAGFSLVGAAVAKFIGGGARFLLGLGTIGIVLYIALLLHIPAVPVLIAMVVVSTVVLAATKSKIQNPKSKIDAAGVVTVIPILSLLFASAILPLGDFDGRAFWVLKAKAIAVEGQIDGPFFQGMSGVNPKNEYPLLVPVAAAAVMIVSGEPDDIQVRWIYVLALGSLALHARRWVGVWPAALIAWLPQFAIASEGGALSGYNDIILAAFAACAFFELVDARSPLRFGIWTSFLILTKNEGLPFALVLLAVAMVIWRRRAAIALAPVMVGFVTLVVWRLRVDPTDDDRLEALLPTLPQQLDRFIPAVTGFAQRALDVDRWGFFWIAVALSAVVLAACREWRVLALPSAVIAGLWGIYTAAYMVTSWQLADHLNASASRLLMHFIGPAVFLIGAAARSRYSRDRHQPTEASPALDLQRPDPFRP